MNVLRVACCVLRAACCVLRAACCVLRARAACVLRVACCVLRVASCVLRSVCVMCYVLCVMCYGQCKREVRLNIIYGTGILVAVAPKPIFNEKKSTSKKIQKNTSVSVACLSVCRIAVKTYNKELKNMLDSTILFHFFILNSLLNNHLPFPFFCIPNFFLR
jgi:hypothetical protein